MPNESSKYPSEDKRLYPDCRCVNVDKPVCFYCEDTAVEEEIEEGSKTDSEDKSSEPS